MVRARAMRVLVKKKLQSAPRILLRITQTGLIFLAEALPQILVNCIKLEYARE